MSAVLTQSFIESEIVRIAARLETGTDDYRDRITAAKRVEAEYRLAFAKAFARHRIQEGLAEKTAEHAALVDCEQLLLERASTDALERAMEEQLRSLRAQLDAVRTLAANVRAQT